MTVEQALVDAWTEMLTGSAAGLDIGHCVLATRAGLYVLSVLGVTAREQVVASTAFTRSAFELAMEGTPIAKWPEMAWSVGVDPAVTNGEAKRGRFPAHVVIRTHECWIDLAAGQFNRPARGLMMAPWCRSVELFLHQQGTWLARTGNVVIQMTELGDKALAQRMKASPDWTRNFREYTDELLTRTRRHIE
jgi:hypothetical protein